MKQEEFIHISAAFLIFAIIAGLSFALDKQFNLIIYSTIFAFVILTLNIFVKKITASFLKMNITHESLMWQRYGFRSWDKLKKPLPIGLIVPPILAIISQGILKIPAFLSYETRAKKSKAFHQFGPYRYASSTDLENGLIGAAGIAAILILAVIAYFLPYSNLHLEYLAKLATYYAFVNMLPVLKLDGTQIYFGGKTIWAVLMTITTIFTALALIIP